MPCDPDCGDCIACRLEAIAVELDQAKRPFSAWMLRVVWSNLLLPEAFVQRLARHMRDWIEAEAIAAEQRN